MFVIAAVVLGSCSGPSVSTSGGTEVRPNAPGYNYPGITQQDMDGCRSRGGVPILFGGGHTNATMVCFSKDVLQ